MNNKILIIILLCVYKIECQQKKVKIDEESQEEEEAEERLEAEDLAKVEEDQEAKDQESEEHENKADDKQKETKIEEKSQEKEEAEERVEPEDLQKADKDQEAEDQEAEEHENKADDKVEEPERPNEEKQSNENDKEQVKEPEQPNEEQESNESDKEQVKESKQPIEENESNESDKDQVEETEELINEIEIEMKHKLEDNASHEENENIFLKKEMELQSQKEKEAGDPADLFGTNQHYNIPANFDDFGRRFVYAYPYIEKNLHGTVSAAELKLDRDVKDYLEAKKVSAKLLTPVKAPPAFVLSIAKQSALLEGTKPKNPSEDIITRNILRTGDFWDSVWKEDVDVDQILRTSNKKSEDLERVTVNIDPGSKLYELISKLKEISPTLLYVINKNNTF